jgi:cell division protein FtsZ
MIHFDLPKEQSSIIKVIGVGGGGSNAVNHMFNQHIEGVNFVICNTDAQAIALSKVPNKIQLGPHLTQGLGAGANPSIGRQATEESLEEIRKILEVNTKMAFVTAGMGGGTGTGGAPIIAKICKGLGILTVGIVTTPFAYEGKKRLLQAEEGIKQLKEHVDTLLVISNDKLRHQFGNLKMKDAFGRADNVLATAAKCITDVINTTGQINVDFADVCTVMRDGGSAILGSGSASGENRAQLAIEQALTSPLLNDSQIRGAKWILININSCEGEHEFTMDEVEIIQNYLLAEAGEDSDVILGMGYDNTLEDHIGITLIATGFHHNEPILKKAAEDAAMAEQKVVVELELNKPEPVSLPLTKEVVAEQPVQEIAQEPAPVLEMEWLPESQANEEPAEKIVFELEQPEIKPVFINTTEEEKAFIEISTSMDQLPTTQLVEFSEPEATTPVEVTPEKITVELAPSATFEPTNPAPEVLSNIPTTGVLLEKPKQIYVDEVRNTPESSTPVNVVEEPVVAAAQEKPVVHFFEEPSEPMTLVVKEMEFNHEPENQEPQLETTDYTASAFDEKSEPTPIDEHAELRRRANERLNKLRNLSFNPGNDPNNEFETVPAYMRRGQDIQVQLADVESFYSHYTVKSTPEQPIELSRINKFLDGKKPD